jgi:hypothetical protein
MADAGKKVAYYDTPDKVIYRKPIYNAPGEEGAVVVKPCPRCGTDAWRMLGGSSHSQHILFRPYIYRVTCEYCWYIGPQVNTVFNSVTYWNASIYY